MLLHTLQKTKLPVWGISCLLFASCSLRSDDGLTGEWYLKHHPESSILVEADHQILRLYPKGVFTCFGSNKYVVGKWMMNENGNYIHLRQTGGNQKQADEFLRMEKVASSRFSAGLFTKMPFQITDRKAVVDFVKLKSRSEKDPYNPEVQKWRLGPKSSESDAQIRKRVLAYLSFLKIMYQHAIDTRMEEIPTGWFPAPIRMEYANGVRMAYNTELEDWYPCFYDSAQAVKGYQLIGAQLYNVSLKSGVDKFERNLDCVEQLLQHIGK